MVLAFSAVFTTLIIYYNIDVYNFYPDFAHRGFFRFYFLMISFLYSLYNISYRIYIFTFFYFILNTFIFYVRGTQSYLLHTHEHTCPMHFIFANGYYLRLSKTDKQLSNSFIHWRSLRIFVHNYLGGGCIAKMFWPCNKDRNNFSSLCNVTVSTLTGTYQCWFTEHIFNATKVQLYNNLCSPFG